jgi:hypothetical protein
LGWVFLIHQTSATGGMQAMSGARISTVGGFAPFILGWTVTMVAMMIPATLPLIRLYRVFARNRMSLVQTRVCTAALLAGYVAVWIVAGLPVYVYALAAESVGRFAAVLPAVLLMIGGVFESISSSRAFESCRLALVSTTVSGTPLASVTRCRFEPGRPRSRGLGPVFSPPLFAGMLEESRLALDQSITSALPRWSSRMRCIRHHTPAFCQSRRRRQQVVPLPPLISLGNIRQGTPLLST